MIEITLYTTGCPICEMLKEKLDQAGIEYTVNQDVEEMKALGITHVPVLQVGGALLDTRAALTYVKEMSENVRG